MRSIQALFKVLGSSEPRFVKCVKSNPQKVPLGVDEGMVANQLHTLSIVESLQIEKQGYTYKRSWKEFLRDFGEILLLLGQRPPNPDAEELQPSVMKDMIVQLLEQIGAPKRTSRYGASTPWALGRSMVFLTPAMQRRCLWLRDRSAELQRTAAEAMQAVLRTRIEVKRFSANEQRVVAMQAMYRRYLVGFKAKRRRRRLIGVWRGVTSCLRLLFSQRGIRRAVQLLQRSVRGWLVRRELPRLRKEKAQPAAARMIFAIADQFYIRHMLLELRIEEKMRQQQEALDCIFRASIVHAARRTVMLQRALGAASTIQRIFRGYIARLEAERVAKMQRDMAAHEIRVYLEVMRRRMWFAENKQSEGYQLAGKAYGVTRSWNALMEFTGRFHQPRRATPPPAGSRSRSWGRARSSPGSGGSTRDNSPGRDGHGFYSGAHGWSASSLPTPSTHKAVCWLCPCGAEHTMDSMFCRFCGLSRPEELNLSPCPSQRDLSTSRSWSTRGGKVRGSSRGGRTPRTDSGRARAGNPSLRSARSVPGEQGGLLCDVPDPRSKDIRNFGQWIFHSRQEAYSLYNRGALGRHPVLPDNLQGTSRRVVSGGRHPPSPYGRSR